MKCPCCASTLREVITGGLTVDICEPGCGGVFFEHFELSQVDEASEEAGAAILEWLETAPTKNPMPGQRYRCPKCATMMMRGQFKPSVPVTVDTCPACAGHWLDRGELASIRQTGGTDADRRRMAQRFVWEAFAEIRSKHHEA